MKHPIQQITGGLNEKKCTKKIFQNSFLLLLWLFFINHFSTTDEKNIISKVDCIYFINAYVRLLNILFVLYSKKNIHSSVSLIIDTRFIIKMKKKLLLISKLKVNQEILIMQMKRWLAIDQSCFFSCCHYHQKKILCN
mgnify:CR=1 FL=1